MLSAERVVSFVRPYVVFGLSVLYGTYDTGTLNGFGQSYVLQVLKL
jgi:hypothetical protein